MADMPHVGYFDANTTYNASEICLQKQCSFKDLLVWAKLNRVPMQRGPAFPKDPTDLIFAGRHLVLSAENNAVLVDDLIVGTILEDLINGE